MSVGQIFWNKEQGRLRTLWRLFGALILGLAMTIALAFVAGISLAILGRMGVVDLDAWLAQGAVSLTELRFLWISLSFTGVVYVLTVVIAARWLDQRPLRDLGLHLDAAWWQDLAFGLVLGALLMTGVFLGQWALGWLRVTGWAHVTADRYPFWMVLAGGVLLYLSVGIYEELVMRGYLLRNLAEGLDTPWWGKRGAVIVAWLLSSVIFGLAHATNPNATWVSTMALMVAGLSLGFGYILTGELAIPIGLHITWNFFQGVIYGFPVSGMTSPGSLIGTVQRGPDLWTGGAFGPEAGLVSGIAIAVGMILTWLWVRWRRGRAAIQRDIASPPLSEKETAQAQPV